MPEGPLGGPRPFAKDDCHPYIKIVPGNQDLPDREMIRAVKDVIFDPSVPQPEKFVITVMDSLNGIDYLIVDEAGAEETMPGFSRGNRPAFVSLGLLEFYKKELDDNHDFEMDEPDEFSFTGKIQVKCRLSNAERQAFQAMGMR